MSKKPFKVVEVPTALGIITGIGIGRVLAEHSDKDDAEEEAYLRWADDPAPDKADYYSVVVIHYL